MLGKVRQHSGTRYVRQWDSDWMCVARQEIAETYNDILGIF